VEAELALLHVDDAKPHEETDEARFRRVKNSLLHSKTLIKPIIVDRESLTIIDGHHRYMSLLSMGYKLIPVVLADYRDDVKGIAPPVFTVGFDAETVEAEVLSLAKRGPGRVIVRGHESVFTVNRDPLDVYYALKRLQSTEQTLGTPIHGIKV